MRINYASEDPFQLEESCSDCDGTAPIDILSQDKMVPESMDSEAELLELSDLMDNALGHEIV